MDSTLSKPNLPGELPAAPLAVATSRIREFMARSKSANTVRAYAADWRHFRWWCKSQGLIDLPAASATLTLYIASLADTARVSTLTRRLSAISQAHQLAGFVSPTQDPQVRIVMAGIRRVKGTAQCGKKPVLIDELRRMIEALPNTFRSRRDQALLLIGFAGALRRSELIAIDVADLEFNRNGMVVTIRRSKTDQEGQGRKVGIPFGSNPKTCPVRAASAWLELLGSASGPVFRPVDRHGHLGAGRLSDKAVALIVKRTASAAGLESSELAAHSLRAGLATSAAAAGVSERAIMAQTGHRSLTALRKYIRDGSLFLENPAGKVGL